MRLLIITQKVDKNDDILGFFHGWIEKLAEHCERIIVICLYKGEYSLPDKVKVLSLGKEEGVSRVKYILRLFKYVWTERKNYDSVFVHMNQEYVLLCGLLWKFLGKKITLWRNHKKGNVFTIMAVMLSNNVFCTSEFSFVAKYKKTKIMPAGIDTNRFKSQISNLKSQISILSLGRISPVKNIDILIEALQLLNEKGVDFIANIYGERKDEYYEKVIEMAKNLGNKVVFHKSVPNYKTPAIYNQNEIFVNLTPSGSFDKTILEAMACGCLPVVSNKSFEKVLPSQFLFKERDEKDLSEKLEIILNLSEKESYKKKFRQYVIKNHSLDNLIEKLIYVFKR